MGRGGNLVQRGVWIVRGPAGTETVGVIEESGRKEGKERGRREERETVGERKGRDDGGSAGREGFLNDGEGRRPWEGRKGDRKKGRRRKEEEDSFGRLRKPLPTDSLIPSMMVNFKTIFDKYH